MYLMNVQNLHDEGSRWNLARYKTLKQCFSNLSGNHIRWKIKEFARKRNQHLFRSLPFIFFPCLHILSDDMTKPIPAVTYHQHFLKRSRTHPCFHIASVVLLKPLNFIELRTKPLLTYIKVTSSPETKLIKDKNPQSSALFCFLFYFFLSFGSFFPPPLTLAKNLNNLSE